MKIFNELKSFLFYKIRKDNLFIKSLGVYNQKIIIYYLFLYLLLFYSNLIKYDIFIFFLKIWLILLIYKIIMDMIPFFLAQNEKLEIYISLNEYIFSKILKILLFINKWKNPLLFLLLYIDKSFFKILRFLVYKLKNNKWFSYKKSDLIIIFYIQYFIFNILLGPLKMLFGFYYTMLWNLIDMPFLVFLLIRSFGLILHIFIISYLIQFLYYTFGVKIYIFFYIILIIISVIIKIIDKDYKYIKLKNINMYHSADYLNFIRNNSTITGLLINYINLYGKSRLNIKYIDIFSSIFKQGIEECFDKYWIFYKRNILLGSINIWKEIKNRPSWYIYRNLIYWVTIPPVFFFRSPSFITTLLFIKYRIQHLNIKLPDNIQSNIDYLYNIDILRLKLLLYMIWDIHNYINIDIKEDITCVFNEMLSYFIIDMDINAYNYLDIDNFKVEKNKYDLPFYDPENNMEFFNKLYIIMGTPPYIEHSIDNAVFSEPLNKYIDLRNNLINCLDKFYNPLGHTWIREEDDVSMDEKEISLIEYKIKDWIINFLKETREEWSVLIEKETIEERNFRLLNEIENLLKKNDNNI